MIKDSSRPVTITALLIALVVLLALLYISQPKQSDDWLNAREITLANGLQLVHIPNHRAPFVHISVWYKAGGAQDPVGKVGLAHYMEHLMFRPPLGEDDYNFSKIVNDWGGDNNAFTSYDTTSYFAKVPSDKAGDYMAMEARRMAKLEPYPEQAKTELEVIQQERAQTVDSNPRRLFNEKSDAFLYEDHPYERSLIGQVSSIKGLTYEDTQSFHHDYYAPNNAILVVAGDIDWAKAQSLTKQHFGTIEKRTRKPDDIGAPSYNNKKEFVVCDERIQQAELHLIYPLPSPLADVKQSAAASILSSLLASEPSNQFYQEIVEKQKIASAYAAQYDANLIHSASLQISLWPIRNDHEANFARTQHALHNALNSITQERIDEVARQESLLYELSADTPITLAISLGYELSKGRTLQEIKTEPALLKSITKSDIDTIVNTYIVDIEPYEMMLLPQKDAQCQ